LPGTNFRFFRMCGREKTVTGFRCALALVIAWPGGTIAPADEVFGVSTRSDGPFPNGTG